MTVGFYFGLTVSSAIAEEVPAKCKLMKLLKETSK